MKGCFAFPKAPTSLEPHHQIVQCHIRTLIGGVGSYPSAEKQSVYSTVPADWASKFITLKGKMFKVACRMPFCFMSNRSNFFDFFSSAPTSHTTLFLPQQKKLGSNNRKATFMYQNRQLMFSTVTGQTNNSIYKCFIIKKNKLAIIISRHKEMS